MSDLRIRPAREDELDAVGQLTVRAYEADDYFSYGVSAGYAATLADARTRSERAELLVAVDGEDRLLGTVTIAPPGSAYTEVARDGELEFRMLAVDPPAQRRGVGVALVRAVVERARELRASRVVLSTQERLNSLHRMYERLGFRRLPDRDWNPTPKVRLIGYGLDL